MVKTGTIFNIQKYSIHDGPGIRTIVFLKGCPLRCQWCSNPESGEPGVQIVFNQNLCVNCGTCLHICGQGAIRKDDHFGRIIDHRVCSMCGKCIRHCPARAFKSVGKIVTIEEVMHEVLKDTVFYRKSGGGVTLSGGEPFEQADFTAELLRRLKQERIPTAVETSGAVSFKNIEPSVDNVDLFLYDIKHSNSEMHRRYTGKDNTRVLENLKELNRLGKRIWVRVPLIANINDDVENMDRVFAMSRHLESVERVELLPYHEYGVGKYAQLGIKYQLEGLKPPTESKIEEILKTAAKLHCGLDVIVRRHG